MSFYFLFQLFSLDKNCFDKKKALKNIQLFGYWHKDIDLEIGRWWLFVRNLRGFDTINRRNAGNLVYVDGFSVALIRHLTSIYILDAAVFVQQIQRDCLQSLPTNSSQFLSAIYIIFLKVARDKNYLLSIDIFFVVLLFLFQRL